ncbi:MAG: MazG family protein [Verrucomicrobia bacterium CG_4_10_14_3_um_filter_43_23]|nr:MAG: nucleotide pyrophosphohydrolase [Verrucomicrobia bacterium CG22_combo_CG10-13_8_21_14_all_43_17]PIX58238.1 MAG: MazG family protein [Verrucomicrobia bacterium CG_4_10_14_3_um_filter_43_23]PIY62959.1 MAG: MazG family protein [Verrucomicrobia bacterium CG_4_10_14_0_8_um_filter_43_34]
MKAIEDLVQTIATLRDPETGCPWDLQQTHSSLGKHLVEETAEILDAVDRDDMDNLREELGDLLIGILMHAQMASERGIFSFADVVKGAEAKLVRRHPHVFGDSKVETMEELKEQWESIKAQENQEKGRVVTSSKKFPKGLPALLYAKKAFEEMSQSGSDLMTFLSAQTGGSLKAMSEQATEQSLALQLLIPVMICTEKGLDPEMILRRMVNQLLDQFEQTNQE